MTDEIVVTKEEIEVGKIAPPSMPSGTRRRSRSTRRTAMADFDSKALFDAINVRLEIYLPDWRLETITARPPQSFDGANVEFVAAHVHSTQRVRIEMGRSFFEMWPLDYCADYTTHRLRDEVSRQWPKVEPPPPETPLCGCGMHRIDPKGDPYVQHREFLKCVVAEEPSIGIRGPGIGISAREGIVTEYDVGRGLVWFEGPPGKALRAVRDDVVEEADR